MAGERRRAGCAGLSVVSPGPNEVLGLRLKVEGGEHQAAVLSISTLGLRCIVPRRQGTSYRERVPVEASLRIPDEEEVQVAAWVSSVRHQEDHTVVGLAFVQNSRANSPALVAVDAFVSQRC